MKMRSRVTALVTVILMLMMQVPFSVFAEDTTPVNADLLSPDTLPDGRFDRKYNAELCFDYSKFNDGFNQYSWHIIDGELPPGLTLYPTSGPTWAPWINGTPTKAGTYTFTIRGGVTVYEGGKNVYVTAAVKTYTLTILPDYPMEFSTDYLHHGYGSSYSCGCYITYGREAEWKLEAVEGETLPEGLSINSSTGEITWENAQVGKYNLKITATRYGNSVSKVFKLIIEPEGGCKHTVTTKTARKAATCKENGLADYWYCDACEQYFLDEECKHITSEDSLETRYTTAFHSDEDDDGKCDTCDKKMPIFKKVTDENEITSCGMYLVVSKIGDKYYTFNALNDLRSIDAVEITQNSDGTFSYPKTNTGVMILKTGFAAECGSLDAGKPRYSLGTTINGIPYTLSADDYSGSIWMDSYGNAKYGYRIKLTDEKYAEIASVYAEYWGGESGKSSGNSSIMTAFEGTKNSETKRFFSFTTKDAFESEGIYTGYGENYFYDDNSLSTSPIELYKLTYAGEAGGQNYTMSDSQCMVTIGSEVTVLDDFGSKEASTVGGISEAVKTNYVESVVSGQTEITGDVSVTTYAAINLTDEESTKDAYDYTSISSLAYEITPKIEIKGTDPEKTIVKDIDNGNLDGSEITLTLCVGDMYPKQIIHYKKDGTKEFFYREGSEDLKPGQKTFSFDEGYEKGNFVTFTVDSFSKFKILATAISEEPISVGNATVTPPVAGQTPTFTAVSDDPSRYSVELLKWIDVENNMEFNVADLSSVNGSYYNYKFIEGKKYEVMVRFTAVGDYELSYNNKFTINGKETWWRSNGLIRTYTFTAKSAVTNTVVSGNSFTVTGINIDGCTVILALYKEDSQGNSQLVECQTVKYSGSEKTFTATATDYTSAKVMSWKSLDDLEPVTEVENVNLK